MGEGDLEVEVRQKNTTMLNFFDVRPLASVGPTWVGELEPGRSAQAKLGGAAAAAAAAPARELIGEFVARLQPQHQPHLCFSSSSVHLGTLRGISTSLHNHPCRYMLASLQALCQAGELQASLGCGGDEAQQHQCRPEYMTRTPVAARLAASYRRCSSAANPGIVSQVK